MYAMPASSRQGFRLARYFTLTSLAAFVVVAVVLSYAYRAIAIDAMLDLQENANVALTRVFANTLWEHDFGPFVDSVKGKRAAALTSEPGIQRLHDKALALLKGSSAFKIKVYDMTGMTVYSTELAQIGEDKSMNSGVIAARQGKTRSELVHKNTFSALEGEVQDRDLIQSYIPGVNSATGSIVGVFEIYSDVTPFLREIGRKQWYLVGAVVGLLAALYFALFLIVKYAQNIIERQNREREQAQNQLAHSAKLAALGQMVAGVAHQLNSPLAFSHNNVSLAIERLESVEITPKEIETTREMLGDVLDGIDRMAELVVRMRDFTRLDRSAVAEFDLNEGLRSVAYMARSIIPGRIRLLEEYADMPKIHCSPSQLNHVFFNMITNAAQAIEREGTITVRTAAEHGMVRVEIADTGKGIESEVLPHIFDTYFTTKSPGEGTGLGLSIAQDIVRGHGGEIRVSTRPGDGTIFTVLLPVRAGHEGAPAA